MSGDWSVCAELEEKTITNLVQGLTINTASNENEGLAVGNSSNLDKVIPPPTLLFTDHTRNDSNADEEESNPAKNSYMRKLLRTQLVSTSADGRDQLSSADAGLAVIMSGDWSVCAELEEKTITNLVQGLTINTASNENEGLAVGNSSNADKVIPPPTLLFTDHPRNDSNADEEESNPAKNSYMRKLLRTQLVSTSADGRDQLSSADAGLAVIMSGDWSVCAELEETTITNLVQGLTINTPSNENEGLAVGNSSNADKVIPPPTLLFTDHTRNDSNADEEESNPAKNSYMRKLLRTHLVSTSADGRDQLSSADAGLAVIMSGDWSVCAELEEKTITNLVQGLTINTASNENEGLAVGNSSNADKVIPPPTLLFTDHTRNDSNADEEESNPAKNSYMRKLLRTQLVSTSADVEIQRHDPLSPLCSVKSFEELKLSPELLKGVYAMGFNTPSKIQETALPTLLADPPKNMIAQSQSGTGKTAAFVLACLSRVNTNYDYPQVLILSPTYELAQQTGTVAKQMAHFCPDMRFCIAVRGEKKQRGKKINDHIVIGTPGKVLDWGTRFKFIDFSRIKVFVLDEADVMISTQGHLDQAIRIHKLLPKDCQMMFFSATYSPEVMNFAEIIIPDPVIIGLRKEQESLKNIRQCYVMCKNADEKFIALSNIYGVITIGQVIIFCHTRKTASRLAEKMTKEGHAVSLLSGKLEVNQRTAVLNRFRDGKEKVLITTNVSARGIDVEQVTVVANFDLPVDMKGHADCETYLHRISRSGRFGKIGLAINMVDSKKAMAVLREIEDHFGKKIVELDAYDLDDIERFGQS